MKKNPGSDALKDPSLKGSVPVVKKNYRGDPPCSSGPDLSKIEISRRVFGVIQNPSGFGVFRPMSTPGFKGFGSNFLIFEKSLFEFRFFLRNDHFD